MGPTQLVVAREEIVDRAPGEAPLEATLVDLMRADGWRLTRQRSYARRVVFAPDDLPAYRTLLAPNRPEPPYAPMPALGHVPSAHALGVAVPDEAACAACDLTAVHLEFLRAGMETEADITATPEPLGRAWARSVLHPVDMEPLGTATAMVTDEAIVVDAGSALVQMTCTAPRAGDRAAAAEVVAAIRSRLALALSTSR